ncbi:hypothetical protein [Polynucleobacter sp.]|uniref:hypothetical protein n=1 Tax=Polynucleobacter sp. TaxID=2029855 RepID=UPI00301AC7BB
MPFIWAVISSGELAVKNPLSPSYIYSSNVSDHYRSSHSHGGFGANRHLALCYPLGIVDSILLILAGAAYTNWKGKPYPIQSPR